MFCPKEHQHKAGKQTYLAGYPPVFKRVKQDGSTTMVEFPACDLSTVRLLQKTHRSPKPNKSTVLRLKDVQVGKNFCSPGHPTMILGMEFY